MTWCAGLAVALLLAGGAAGGTDTPAPGKSPPVGAYCKLPEGDEPPKCLGPATAKYGELFQGLAEGRVDEASAEKMETDLTATKSYDALSSLAWAYYQLSKRAAATQGADPEIAARLERWNAVLGQAFHESGDDAHFRSALREAAGDIEARAPGVPVPCTDAAGNTTECDSRAAMVAAMRERQDSTGIRGALARMLRGVGRWFGGGGDDGG